MTRAHMKRLAAPRTWPIHRKDSTFISKPRGGHGMHFSMPLTVVLRDMLGYAIAAKEARRLLKDAEVRINEKRVVDGRRGVGLLDTLHFPASNEAYRLVMNRKGKLALLKIPVAEAAITIAKVKGKTTIRGGKLQLSLQGGRCIEHAGKDMPAIGDALVLALPDCKPKKVIRLQPGSAAYLVEGGHSGNIGRIEQVREQKVVISLGSETFETLKRFVIPVGTDKPECTVMENGR